MQDNMIIFLYLQIILVVNIIFLLCGTVCLTGLLTWDLTSGVQTVTGRCVWAGYCIWVRQYWAPGAALQSLLVCSFIFSALLSLLACIFFLLVNLLAFSGITRSSSWSNTFPSTSYRMLYPWLLSYFILNTSILPAGNYYKPYPQLKNFALITSLVKAHLKYVLHLHQFT